jgi:hypothetical protein
MPVRGDIVIADSIPSWARLAIGSAGKVLQSDGVDPAWSDTLTLASLINTQQRNSIARAYLSADQTSFPDGVWTKINLNAESFDIGGNFDVSNYRYVIPVTGYYQVSWEIMFTNAGSVITIAQSAVYVNGTLYSVGGKMVAATGQINAGGLPGSSIIYGVIGQYIELYGYLDTSDSSTSTIASAAYRTNMSINLVST